jgi:hypothetical protein
VTAFASSFEVASCANGTPTTLNHIAVDEVAVYSAAMDAARIRQQYHAGRGVA